ncbi:MAG: SpoIIE family protein phosphatase [Lachnospiraceae bacterium]|nr:SpoIIE family protein phosphatase [Lachnospiraceae bacterium]
MDWVVVVDDDVTNLKMAGRILSKNNMRVTALKSGMALLDYVKTNKPDLILLDIKMPGMDGFETMRRLQEQLDPSEQIPVIFLTADESQEAETQGLALGAMDFIKKPFIPDVLVLRVRLTIDLVRLQHDLERENERIRSELAMASRIQTAMLPGIFPAFPERKEFDIYASMDPVRRVGGDFYDFFFIDRDRLCLLIADVSGKGIPAALFMMASKIILADNAKSGKSPARILQDTNEAICANNPEGMFVTVWLGILDITTGLLTTANAGHEYPALMHADGKFELFKDKHGLVVGGMPGMRYHEHTLQLYPGSKLFVYTDGVPEATDSENRLFGTERMLNALNAHTEDSPKQILRGVRQAVNDFVADMEQFDDLTMLCLEYKYMPKER